MILLSELQATLSQNLPAPKREGEIRRIPLLISTSVWALQNLPPAEVQSPRPIREVVLRAELFRFREQSWLEWEVVEINGILKREFSDESEDHCGSTSA